MKRRPRWRVHFCRGVPGSVMGSSGFGLVHHCILQRRNDTAMQPVHILRDTKFLCVGADTIGSSYSSH